MHPARRANYLNAHPPASSSNSHRSASSVASHLNRHGNVGRREDEPNTSAGPETPDSTYGPCCDYIEEPGDPEMPSLQSGSESDSTEYDPESYPNSDATDEDPEMEPMDPDNVRTAPSPYLVGVALS